MTDRWKQQRQGEMCPSQVTADQQCQHTSWPQTQRPIWRTQTNRQKGKGKWSISFCHWFLSCTLLAAAAATTACGCSKQSHMRGARNSRCAYQRACVVGVWRGEVEGLIAPSSVNHISITSCVGQCRCCCGRWRQGHTGHCETESRVESKFMIKVII